MATWDPDTQYVQSGIDNRRFVSAKYTFLASGPPRLGQLGGGTSSPNLLAAALEADNGSLAVGNLVHPMGFIQNITLGQNKQIARIFEIGSDRSYFIPGRAVGQLSLGRIFMHGPSLLRLLMAAYQDKIGPTQVDAMITSSAVASNANPHDVIVPPGFENMFLNLQSDLFDQHFGVAMYIKDNNKDTLGAVYFESVNIPQHGLQTDASGVVFSENAGLQYDRMVPIRMGSPVPLISARTPDNRPGYEDGYPGLGSLDGRRLPSGTSHHEAGAGPDPQLRAGGGPALQPFALGDLHGADGGTPLPGGGGHHHLHAPEPPQRRRQVDHLLLRVRQHRSLRQRGRDHPRGGVPDLQPLPHGGPHRGGHRAHRRRLGSCKGAGMNLPDTAALAVHFGTEDLLYEKRAGALDIAGRLAAAAVLMQLLDSQRRPPNEVRHAERALGPMLRRIESDGARTGIRQEDFHARPKMFIPAERLSPEAERDFYQMGFLPNVPVGMDHGMVRLASVKQAGIFSTLASKVQGRFPSLAPKPVPAVPPPAPKPAPKPVAAPKPPAQESSGLLPLAMIAGGAGIAAASTMGTKKVLDYAQEESHTPWGLQPYGAPRLNTTVNAYGQPMPLEVHTHGHHIPRFRFSLQVRLQPPALPDLHP